jgi:hypothetical protein
MKRLFQIKTEDWISFLFPNLTDIHLTDMQSDIVARIKQESIMDNVKMLNNECIIHFEPMGYKDDALPARMLRYRADIWEYTLGHDLGLPSIKQIVIFFSDKHDNGIHHLDDTWETEQTLDYNYKVVKVWEIDSADIVKRKLIGLYPLLPLAKHEDNMDDEKIIVSAIETIHIAV